MKSAKNAFYKKGAPKLIFFNEFFFSKDSDDFWHRKFTLKVQNWHILANCDWMETQNLVISFNYSWFLAKNLAYDECWIMKFHYRNSSSLEYLGYNFVWQVNLMVKSCSIKKWTDLLALTNLYFEHRTLDLIFFFLIVWYYCTLTIRESILKVNGSKIKVRFLNNLSIFCT